MITKYIKGNLLDHGGPIAHGVNCQGKMNSGVAKAIRDKYPLHYKEYEYMVADFAAPGCLVDQTSDLLGLNLITYPLKFPYLWHDGKGGVQERSIDIIGSNSIIALFTQLNYGRKSKRYVNYAKLSECFTKLNDLETGGNQFILGIPKIGTGLGGGDWDVIKEIINDATPDLEIWVYEL